MKLGNARNLSEGPISQLRPDISAKYCGVHSRLDGIAIAAAFGTRGDLRQVGRWRNTARSHHAGKGSVDLIDGIGYRSAW